MAKDNKNKYFKEGGHINGLLDKGCNFEGKLTFDGVVQVNGDFRGEIFSDGTLVVGRDASIDAKVFVDTIIIDGNVQGQVEAKSKIELHNSGTLIANVQTKALMIEDGGKFRGSCEMPVGCEQHEVVTAPETESDEVYTKSIDEAEQLAM
jgi:cytoskeletal protein CcmA (bactofilin family)